MLGLRWRSRSVASKRRLASALVIVTSRFPAGARVPRAPDVLVLEVLSDADTGEREIDRVARHLDGDGPLGEHGSRRAHVVVPAPTPVVLGRGDDLPAGRSPWSRDGRDGGVVARERHVDPRRAGRGARV
jgi:hypothetical protein